MTDTDAIRTLVEAIRPILAGHPAPVQSAALADCLARWLAGHEVPGKMHLTRKMRAALLAEHCALVQQLVPINAKAMGTDAMTGRRMPVDPERVDAYHTALQATLLFHSASPWDDTKKLRWLELTGEREATTRELCDAVRRALG